MSPAVRSLRAIPIYVFIPPIYTAEYKIMIETSSATYDITDRIYSGGYTDGATETIGNFEFIVDNSDEYYTTLINLYDMIKIYIDYATEAVTLRFTGMIEKVSKRNDLIIFKGRGSAEKVMGLTVTKSYDNQYTHDIILDLISNYCSYITTANIDTTEDTDTQITVNWYEKPFWECILDLCNRAGYDAYIDQDFDFNYFVSGTRLNTTDCVVHEHNLLETGDFTPDLTSVKNKIIVYGAKVEDMQIIAVAKDDASISEYKEKKSIINDTSCITTEQAQARADYELSIQKDPPVIGEVTSLGLATILPGQKVRISDPESGLQPNYYSIRYFNHKFENGEMNTTLIIYKETSTLPRILKKRITFETESPSMENPYEMEQSWFYDFNTDEGTHNDTQIADGRLKATSASGYWISTIKSLSSNASACEFRVKGDGLVGTTYFVSSDSGANWQSITPNTLKTLAPPGQNLRIKVQFAATSTEIDSLMLLYKT